MAWQPTTVRRPDEAFSTATEAVRVTMDAGPGYRGVLRIVDRRDLWSAPAERSGDGAFDRRAAENPKRRGASLPAALQNAGVTTRCPLRNRRESATCRS